MHGGESGCGNDFSRKALELLRENHGHEAERASAAGTRAIHADHGARAIAQPARRQRPGRRAAAAAGVPPASSCCARLPRSAQEHHQRLVGEEEQHRRRHEQPRRRTPPNRARARKGGGSPARRRRRAREGKVLTHGTFDDTGSGRLRESNASTGSFRPMLLAGQHDARGAPADIHHQVIDALDEAGRVVELAALGQQGLVEQHRGPVVEAASPRTSGAAPPGASG